MFSLRIHKLSCTYLLRDCQNQCYFGSPVHRLIIVSSFRAESGNVIHTQHSQAPGAQQAVGSFLLILHSSSLHMKQADVNWQQVYLSHSWLACILTFAHTLPSSPWRQRILKCADCWTAFENHRCTTEQHSSGCYSCELQLVRVKTRLYTTICCWVHMQL